MVLHTDRAAVRAEPMPRSQADDITRLIDSERYPLHRRDGEGRRRLLAACRDSLAETGACVLAGFLRPEAVEQALSELEPLLGEAYYCQKDHNLFLDAGDAALPDDHPRNRRQVSDLGCLADDQIPAGSVLRALYLSEALRAFIAELLGVARLYPYADPLGSLNLNVFQPGQQLGWHYDNADYATTLMLQPAEAGGVYEYLPWSRDPEGRSLEVEAAVLDGARERVRGLAMGPGALVLFRGRRSLHRVSPVAGARPRLIAVLSYDTEPGVMLTEHNRRLFYGRVS